MGQESICGFAIETECLETEFQEVKLLEFHTWFIDNLASLFDTLNKPKVSFSLFEPLENASLAVVIIPTVMGNLTLESTVSTTQNFSIRLLTNETGKVKAYAELMMLAKIVINFIEVISHRRNLTYLVNSGITNNNEAVLSVLLRKII